MSAPPHSGAHPCGHSLGQSRALDAVNPTGLTRRGSPCFRSEDPKHEATKPPVRPESRGRLKYGRFGRATRLSEGVTRGTEARYRRLSYSSGGRSAPGAAYGLRTDCGSCATYPAGCRATWPDI